MPPVAGTRLKIGDHRFSRLGDAEWLDGPFSAGDLMMAMVLRELVETGLLERYANLGAYVRRCTDRPAFR